jgi:hypothetical protein
MAVTLLTFCTRCTLPPGQFPEELGELEKKSSHFIGIQTCNLLAYSIGSQLTTQLQDPRQKEGEY